jgi:hypothetical protein
VKNPRNFPLRKFITDGEKNSTIGYRHNQSSPLSRGALRLTPMCTQADPNT